MCLMSNYSLSNSPFSFDFGLRRRFNLRFDSFYCFNLDCFYHKPKIISSIVTTNALYSLIDFEEVFCLQQCYLIDLHQLLQHFFDL